MSHDAGSVYVHCPRCAGEVEVTVRVDSVMLRRDHLTVNLDTTAYEPHVCFPAAVAIKKKGRRSWADTVITQGP